VSKGWGVVRTSYSDMLKPKVTFMLLTYNQEDYVHEALNGAFSQTYQPLEIIVSDDYSTDNTYKIIEDVVAKYTGPHHIILNRNNENLGIGGHVNKVMELAKGEFVVASAGDDISHSNRVDLIVNAFLSSEERVFSVWSAARYIDSDGIAVHKIFPGNSHSYTDKSIVRNLDPLIGATHAWRREVFDVFGPLMDDVVFEDNAISFRSYLLGDIKYIDKELVDYRTHEFNITNFTKIADKRVLYSLAARRSTWVLTGIKQRFRDLDVANNSPVFHRNYHVLKSELKKMQAVFKRRIKAYEYFPKISLSSVGDALRDIEVYKVAIRSFLYRIKFGRGQ
jgi:glycosyltransferase involved in cell wall biosynthesis